MTYCVDDLSIDNWDQLFTTEAANHHQAAEEYLKSRGLPGEPKRDSTKQGPILVWRVDPNVDAAELVKHPRRNVVFSVETA